MCAAYCDSEACGSAAGHPEGGVRYPPEAGGPNRGTQTNNQL